MAMAWVGPGLHRAAFPPVGSSGAGLLDDGTRATSRVPRLLEGTSAMGIFSRTKSVPNAAVGGDPFTDRERERVTALWRLTALSREEFETTYGTMLRGFWRCVAAPRGAAWTALKSEALTCAVAALRARQAHVLPRFAAAEDAARLAELMSFALATAVVVERFGAVVGRASAPDWCPLSADVPVAATLGDVAVPSAYGALLLPRLVGGPGLAWLAQEPVALRALAAYFGPGPSELRAIAEAAERRVGLAMDRPFGANTSPPKEGGAAVDVEAETREGPAAAPEPIGGEGAGWRWINWVRRGLHDGTIEVNARGGWLHNRSGEAYVVVPDGFQPFASIEGVEANTVRNRVARLGRHRERSRYGNAANLFRAELAGGRRVEGMLFPGELFWDDDRPPEMPGAGGRRPRAAPPGKEP